MMGQVLGGLISPMAECQIDDLNVLLSGKQSEEGPETVDDAIAMGFTQACAECAMAYGDRRRLLMKPLRRLAEHKDDDESDQVMEICFGVNPQEMEAAMAAVMAEMMGEHGGHGGGGRGDKDHGEHHEGDWEHDKP